MRCQDDVPQQSVIGTALYEKLLRPTNNRTAIHILRTKQYQHCYSVIVSANLDSCDTKRILTDVKAVKLFDASIRRTDVCLNHHERDPREEVPNKGIIEPNCQCSLIVSISQANYGLAPLQFRTPN